MEMEWIFNFVARYFEIGQADKQGLFEWSENNKGNEAGRNVLTGDEKF